LEIYKCHKKLLIKKIYKIILKSYQVTGEIIPINSDGTLDTANKGILTYTQKREFPRIYANLFDIAP
jgi:hypothetical protein